jgi:tryptophan synthase alpha chain
VKAMNRIDRLFQTKKNNILSIYFTAGHPELNCVVPVITALAEAGADMIEIGMPFSDPVADGPVIQKSNLAALTNGMSVKLLFEQLKDIRKLVDLPLILMGDINPVLQYGIEKFASDCNATGIDGVIIPDLPLDIYLTEFKSHFTNNNLHNIFLVSPQTSNERLKQLDIETRGFLYMVAASATTGMRGGFADYQVEYFNRVQSLNLKSPRLIGFGISDHETFEKTCQYANGAIIGSAFVKTLDSNGSSNENIQKFVKLIIEG